MKATKPTDIQIVLHTNIPTNNKHKYIYKYKVKFVAIKLF